MPHPFESRQEAREYSSGENWLNSLRPTHPTLASAASSNLWTDRIGNQPFLYHQQVSSHQIQPMRHGSMTDMPETPNFSSEIITSAAPTSLTFATGSALEPLQ